MSRSLALVITCEHAGNGVPDFVAGSFSCPPRVLASHRAFDRGALLVAENIGRHFACEVLKFSVSRLVIDANRPLEDPGLFSKYGRRFDEKTQQVLIENYHQKHWRSVEALVTQEQRDHRRVLHLAVHSFTPTLCGVTRQADLALLYDPKRSLERGLSERLLRQLSQTFPRWRLRRNYPYRGSDPGLTTALRQRFSPDAYLGIELELNQKRLRSEAAQGRVVAGIVSGLTKLMA